jgi:hypothetical protein
VLMEEYPGTDSQNSAPSKSTLSHLPGTKARLQQNIERQLLYARLTFRIRHLQISL